MVENPVAGSELASLDSSKPVPQVSLWSYNWIAVNGLLLSVPGGFSLALLNWRRMGLHDKVRTNLVLAIALLFVGFVVGPRLNNAIQYWLYFGLLAFTIAYLRLKMKEDLKRYRASGMPVKTANWFVGLVIGLGTTFIVVILAAIVNVIVELVLRSFSGGL